ncbi:NUDIX domain-containing protein [Gemmata sp. G18]|uniref:NUDIX domain-containing protein n=1 Tax=Gemmata palustris TaxID=2822762 RepID=A0ABS5BXS1_9BACT|nr:NUDIX domain-containing protein [Gemmata palustris]MBP3958539.1 NUDIX domain-containing protein [Gemmata palustris]
MRPSEVFTFCPRCAAPRAPENVGQSPLRCAACQFTFYFNPTVAAAAFVSRPDGRALFIRRAHDPAAGKLGIPGGFIDFGETAEEGLRREIREEVGLAVENVRFLMSFPNMYLYRDVTYPVVDLVFTASALAPDTAAALDGVAGIEWRFPRDVADDELAFDSMRVSIAAVRAGAGG